MLALDCYQNMCTTIIDLIDLMRDQTNDREVIIGFNIHNKGQRIKFSNNENIDSNTWRQVLEEGGLSQLEKMNTLQRGDFINQNIVGDNSVLDKIQKLDF